MVKKSSQHIKHQLLSLKDGLGSGVQPWFVFYIDIEISSPLLSDSRIQTYLLASLESSQHKTPPPLPGGLSPVSRELKELAVHFSRLVNHNKLVYSPFYKNILQKILTAGGGPGTET